MAENKFILKLSCLDQPGITAALATALASRGANIVEANQFCDRRPTSSSFASRSRRPRPPRSRFSTLR